MTEKDLIELDFTRVDETAQSSGAPNDFHYYTYDVGHFCLISPASIQLLCLLEEICKKYPLICRIPCGVFFLPGYSRRRIPKRSNACWKGSKPFPYGFCENDSGDCPAVGLSRKDFSSQAALFESLNLFSFMF